MTPHSLLEYRLQEARDVSRCVDPALTSAVLTGNGHLVHMCSVNKMSGLHTALKMGV